MEPLKVIELLLVVGLIPLVIAMFNNLRSRVQNLEDKKVDKELFKRLEDSVESHRKETREGFHNVESVLREFFRNYSK